MNSKCFHFSLAKLFQRSMVLRMILLRFVTLKPSLDREIGWKIPNKFQIKLYFLCLFFFFCHGNKTEKKKKNSPNFHATLNFSFRSNWFDWMNCRPGESVKNPTNWLRFFRFRYVNDIIYCRFLTNTCIIRFHLLCLKRLFHFNHNFEIFRPMFCHIRFH